MKRKRGARRNGIYIRKIGRAFSFHLAVKRIASAVLRRRTAGINPAARWVKCTAGINPAARWVKGTAGINPAARWVKCTAGINPAARWIGMFQSESMGVWLGDARAVLVGLEDSTHPTLSCGWGALGRKGASSSAGCA
jgi:hypothetical protein